MQVNIYLTLVIILISKTLVKCREIYLELAQEEWNSYKLEFDKTYFGTIEEKFRFKIFINNMQKILRHNQEFEFGKHSYKLGVNQFTDMLLFEVNDKMNGLNATLIANEWKNDKDAITYISPENVKLPEEMNWIDKGAVTEIKDQGNCGSCYAFSAIGALEGQHFLATKQLVSLSEQNILDCSRKFGNNGCNGGWMVYSYKYVIVNKGVDTENGYPYKARMSNCKYDVKAIGATEKSYVQLTQGNETAIMEAVATRGPVSIGIDASHQSFQMYAKGIYYEPKCSSEHANHAVLIVGYGKENGMDYWLVKNSWGKTWGDHGYIKMSRNRNNNCCIACYASYPIV